MAVTTPVLNPVAAFDATKPMTFTFSSVGGNQVVANKLTIKNATTLEVLYENTVQSFALEHVLPENTLLNGLYYQAAVVAYDASGAASASSLPIQFYCFSEPTFTFANLTDGDNITTSTYSFVAQYEQIENELLNQYSFVLYDSEDKQLSTSGVQYVGSTSLPPTLVVWTVNGLDDNTDYKIVVNGVTVYGTQITTGIVSFSVRYDAPEVPIPIELTNKCDEGYVQIRTVSLKPIGGNITSLKLKRRKYGDFSWVTINSASISPTRPYDIVWHDNLAQSGTTYEYAVVPVTAGVEGRYVTDSILAMFNGIFVCSRNVIYRLYEGATYGSGQREQKVGVFEPYGRKYPVVTSNAKTNYDTGSFSGLILPDDYMKTGDLDRKKIVDRKDAILNFLTDKSPKIVKDFNTNIWLCMITGSPSVSYTSNYGMGIVSVGATWAEIGDANDANDLYDAGLVEEV